MIFVDIMETKNIVTIAVKKNTKSILLYSKVWYYIRTEVKKWI